MLDSRMMLCVFVVCVMWVVRWLLLLKWIFVVVMLLFLLMIGMMFKFSSWFSVVVVFR